MLLFILPSKVVGARLDFSSVVNGDACLRINRPTTDRKNRKNDIDWNQTKTQTPCSVWNYKCIYFVGVGGVGLQPLSYLLDPTIQATRRSVTWIGKNVNGNMECKSHARLGWFQTVATPVSSQLWLMSFYHGDMNMVSWLNEWLLVQYMDRLCPSTVIDKSSESLTTQFRLTGLRLNLSPPAAVRIIMWGVSKWQGKPDFI